MGKNAKNPFTYAAIPMLSTGAGFTVTGVLGRPAFGYIGVTMMVTGAVLLMVGIWRNSRKA